MLLITNQKKYILKSKIYLAIIFNNTQLLYLAIIFNNIQLLYFIIYSTIIFNKI